MGASEHFLDDLIKSGTRSAEEIRQHSIYIKPSRLSSVLERSPADYTMETDTQIDRMTVSDSDATQFNRISGATMSDAGTVMNRQSMMSMATTFDKVVEEDEESVTMMTRDQVVEEAAGELTQQ